MSRTKSADMSRTGSTDMSAARLLMVNQLTINIGFYMLMPYLATHLTTTLGLAVWLTGLILGVRNLTQQGLFLVGGSLADRIGYKPMIVTGLILRTAGFAMLGLVEAVPALLVGSALTGLAGAFFNPAARAYLAQESVDKATAFARFNVFYQLGILIGPLVGLLLQGVAFRAVCLVAAALFAVLAVVQVGALPARRGGRAGASETMLDDWRRVVRDRPFVLFSLAMAGSYTLSFQIYLSLPLAAGQPGGVTLLFVLSGAMAATLQVRVTSWIKARWSPGEALSRGLWLMGGAFLPLTVAQNLPTVLITTALLTLATMVVYPFEMATIASYAGESLVGTYYGFASTVAGVGIAAGNLAVGALLDLGVPSLPWWVLAATGAACALAVHRLLTGTASAACARS